MVIGGGLLVGCLVVGSHSFAKEWLWMVSRSGWLVGWLKGEEQKTDTVVAAAGKLCVATMNGDGGANEGSRTHTRRR